MAYCEKKPCIMDCRIIDGCVIESIIWTRDLVQCSMLTAHQWWWRLFLPFLIETKVKTLTRNKNGIIKYILSWHAFIKWIQSRCVPSADGCNVKMWTHCCRSTHSHKEMRSDEQTTDIVRITLQLQTTEPYGMGRKPVSRISHSFD